MLPFICRSILSIHKTADTEKHKIPGQGPTQGKLKCARGHHSGEKPEASLRVENVQPHDDITTLHIIRNTRGSTNLQQGTVEGTCTQSLDGSAARGAPLKC